MSERNPHHPVTEKVHDHWHKICAMLLVRLGVKIDDGEIIITLDDVQRLDALGQGTIIIHDTHDGLHLRLASEAEAEKWLRRSVQ